MRLYETAGGRLLNAEEAKGHTVEGLLNALLPTTQRLFAALPGARILVSSLGPEPAVERRPSANAKKATTVVELIPGVGVGLLRIGVSDYLKTPSNCTADVPPSVRSKTSNTLTMTLLATESIRRQSIQQNLTRWRIAGPDRSLLIFCKGIFRRSEVSNRVS